MKIISEIRNGFEYAISNAILILKFNAKIKEHFVEKMNTPE